MSRTATRSPSNPRCLEPFRQLQEEASFWRRRLHQYPELQFRLDKTSRFVADKLASFGIRDIEAGIAETGLVALIRGDKGPGPTIGLRADMDALPIVEASDKPWKSKSRGLMHACGHDGHTAMLLGAAKYLAQTRNFRGTVALILQPAEEGAPEGQVQGALKMVQEGIMDRYDISRVFGLHNSPDLALGTFGIRDGGIMAALDEFDIVVKGKGGHAAKPHQTIDPVVIAAQIINALQMLVSRSTNPIESLVISVTKLGAGEAYNVIPGEARMGGSVRTLAAALHERIELQIFSCAQGVARAFGADIDMKFRRTVPVTLNHTEETRLAANAARGVVGSEAVDDNIVPRMGSEDFSYMLQARPGAFIFVGNGPTHGLHHPSYDFNDEALPYGIGYWVNLVETVLAA
jgi:hippurate hydrolase